MSGKRKWDLAAGAASLLVLVALMLAAAGYGIVRYQREQRELTLRRLQGELAFAAAAGDVLRVQTLLRAGVPPSALSSDGRSALHGAVKLRKNAVVKVLLDAGADPDAHGPRVPSALVEAVSGISHPGHTRLVQMLLDAGADPNGRDPGRIAMIVGNRSFNVGNQTALTRAVIGRHDELVRRLLRHKADPNLTDSDGKSALHWWALVRRNDRPALALGPLLVRKGADPHLADQSGKAPLDYARELGDPRLRETLEKVATRRSRKPKGS